MIKTGKLKSKLCAWLLVCVTVLTTLGSSGASVFADNGNKNTQTETQVSTLSVKSGEGGEISVELPDGQIETATVENDLKLELETGTTVKATISVAEGYQVATYTLTTDSGNSKDIETYDSFSFDITESTTLESTYSKSEPINEKDENVEIISSSNTNPKRNDYLQKSSTNTTSLNGENEKSTSTNNNINNEVTWQELLRKFNSGKKEYEQLHPTKSARNNVSLFSVGDTIYSASLSGYRSPITITQYTNGGYKILKTWNEGLLGATPSTWMYCCDPTANFSEGYKTGVPATNYFSEYTIKVIGALLYWYDTNKCRGISLGDDYMFKQEIVWTVANLEKQWYPNCLFEHGNGQKCNLGHSLYTHRDEWYYTGLNWAMNNYDSVATTATVYQGVGQPLIEVHSSYNPKGSAYLQKSSANTSLTSGNGNYSLANAVYGVYSNSACTTSVGTLTTNSSGTSNTLSLNAGTYYVKEKSAPAGYILNSTVYTLTVTSGKTTVIKASDSPRTVTINLQKKSDNPNVTDGNDLYKLSGAEYSIYTDSACTQYVTKMITDEEGMASVTGLALNTYYVKETKAPEGYAKDTTVYTVSATSGTTDIVTKSVTSTEQCLMDPVGILIRKVDAETGTAIPVDEGTLQDAQFEVKLYDTMMSEDPAESGFEPVLSLVMRTDEDGIIQLNNSYVVSGDQVPTDKDGYPSLPYGTLTFKEIKSPSGYLVNDTVIVKQITDKDGGLSTVPQYTEPTQKEQPMTLKIIKVQNGTTLRIPNAEFKWELPDGSTHTYKTNENGEVTFKGLEWGTHTITEVKVPDGYSVNKNKITFTVNQDNTISGISGATVTDTDGNFTLVVDEDNLNPTVTYENKPAPFDLHVYKINDADFALEGAEFTLYSDESCTTEWKKGATDSAGNLTFEDLIVGKTYYMKETKAPQGYRIPINDDGSDIVYKIRVTSTPVNDEFTFYVNDKPYTTASTGSYSVSGTKADRVCDMTIINERGKRLPETGSSMMLILLITGVALMGGAIVATKLKKNK